MKGPELSPNSIDAALDVLQNRQICDTVTVCCLMRTFWGNLQDKDIARIVKSPDDHRSGICIGIIEDLLTEPQLRGRDTFGALPCFARWSKVQDKVEQQSGDGKQKWIYTLETPEAEVLEGTFAEEDLSNDPCGQSHCIGSDGADDGSLGARSGHIPWNRQRPRFWTALSRRRI